MGAFTLVRRRRLAALGVLSAAVLSVGPVVLSPASPAHAETTGQASAKAHALLVKVHALEKRAKAAEARYSVALSSVSQSVTSAISSDQQSSEIANRASATQSALADQVLDLYESGSDLTATASFFTSGSLTELDNRSELAAHALSAQVAGVSAAEVAARQAYAAARVAAHQARSQISTARDVAASADEVTSLLAQQSALLRHANNKLAAVRRAAAALAAQSAAFTSITTTSLSGLHILPPSALYLQLYKAAAPTCPGLSWTVLAAIGQVESGHGRNTSTSSAGAEGPMQFEPATFAAYAVDGDHDGKTDIQDPADAIFTAAHYLCANGAGRGPSALSGAILHYNHAVWYLDMVLKLSTMYASAYS